MKTKSKNKEEEESNIEEFRTYGTVASELSGTSMIGGTAKSTEWKWKL